ncbi:hypothetical protein KOR42_14580 [Thalassoglobus neptunius]|uniref:Uncharacterized protein n=1 Tax=Thalassoglobus neptunius TaxID=1938619 RepID=A0A5C5X4P9_9PLAN|nr:tetratricopeptide repeat protein [Thalassoglobus neptunius]TWT58087.1 hypothetical protein KOR42_14580 [Thalassoglobus neptunius]
MHTKPRYLFAVVSMWISSSIVFAQDRVTYLPEGAAAPITLVGEVLDSTGEELRLRPSGGIPQSIPADRVVEIETHYDPSHLKGIEFFQNDQLQEAEEAFRAALKREPREWVDRELLAWLTRSYLREGQLTAALQSFRELVSSDPLTRHWGLAPLEWSSRQVSGGLRQAAKPLVVESRATDRLLGASLLMFDPIAGPAARAELNDLARNTNPRISKLARSQLWRLTLSTGEVTQNRLINWQDDIDALPVGLRAGPQFLLAKGYEQIGLPRLAAAEYLKLTILYSEHEVLTAAATLEAARLIGETGLTQEADLLYRELLARFPRSDAAKLAKNQMLTN